MHPHTIFPLAGVCKIHVAKVYTDVAPRSIVVVTDHISSHDIIPELEASIDTIHAFGCNHGDGFCLPSPRKHYERRIDNVSFW